KETSPPSWRRPAASAWAPFSRPVGPDELLLADDWRGAGAGLEADRVGVRPAHHHARGWIRGPADDLSHLGHGQKPQSLAAELQLLRKSLLHSVLLLFV